MSPKELLEYMRSRDFLSLLAFQLMMGVFLGYLFFYNVFYYFSAPFDSQISAWMLLFFFGLVGLLVGYLFPDPRIVMASSISLPMLGALFSFLIFVSPIFSKDIISGNISDDLFIMARLLLINIFLSFIAIFFTSFISLYAFDAGLHDENPFDDD